MGILEEIKQKMEALHNELSNLRKEIRRDDYRIIHKKSICNIIGCSHNTLVQKWRVMKEQGYPLFLDDSTGKISAIEQELKLYMTRKGK